MICWKKVTLLRHMNSSSPGSRSGISGGRSISSPVTQDGGVGFTSAAARVHMRTSWSIVPSAQLIYRFAAAS